MEQNDAYVNANKPSLEDHYVPEPPSERVSVDVNALLSQSDYISLRATYPTERVFFTKTGGLKNKTDM